MYGFLTELFILKWTLNESSIKHFKNIFIILSCFVLTFDLDILNCSEMFLACLKKQKASYLKTSEYEVIKLHVSHWHFLFFYIKLNYLRMIQKTSYIMLITHVNKSKLLKTT